MEVLIPKRLIERAKRLGKGGIFELAQLVTWVLLNPRKIYEGLRRDDDDDPGETDGWLCYSAAPEFAFDYETGERCSRPNRVLLVFVNKERVAYHWRWELEAPEQPGVPADCNEERFVKEKM